MNNINNIINRIGQIGIVIALVFVAMMLIQPNTVAAGTNVTPNMRKVAVVSRKATIVRVATPNTAARNVVSSAVEPIEPTEPRNVVSTATEPPVVNTAKVRVQINGPRVEVVGARITRK